jgi:hypothetical protein
MGLFSPNGTPIKTIRRLSFTTNTIWLTIHNGTTWSPEMLVSSLGSTALNPSITEYWPYIHIVWEEVDPTSGGQWVKYRRYDESTSQFSNIVNVSTSYILPAFDMKNLKGLTLKFFPPPHILAVAMPQLSPQYFPNLLRLKLRRINSIRMRNVHALFQHR